MPGAGEAGATRWVQQVDVFVLPGRALLVLVLLDAFAAAWMSLPPPHIPKWVFFTCP